MNTPQQHGEVEREKGLGGRVRRFIDTELSSAFDKEDRGVDHARIDDHRTPDPAAEFDRTSQGDRTPESDRISKFDRASDAEHAYETERTSELLNDPAGLRDDWQRVQGTFVDDPQRAVHEASVLVDRTLQEIHENVARRQTSDPTSTEDLRVSFQRYREFFQRLLSA